MFGVQVIAPVSTSAPTVPQLTATVMLADYDMNSFNYTVRCQVRVD